MKITVTSKDLAEAIKCCASAVTKRSTLPILSTFHLEAGSGELVLRASDLDRWMKYSVPANVIEPGEVALNAKRLAKIFAENEAEYSIEVDEKNKATITGADETFKLHGLSPAEFPVFPEVKQEVEIFLAAVEWRRLVNGASWAAFTGQGRDNLLGTLLEVIEEKAQLVATNGRMLSATSLSDVAEVKWKVTIPTDTMVGSIQSFHEGEIRIRVGDGLISYENQGKEFVSKLIVGDFPNWRQVVPRYDAPSVTKIKVSRKDLQAAVSRASILSSDLGLGIRISGEGDQIDLESVSSDGSSCVSINAEIDGPSSQVTLNHQFLLRPLRNWACEDIEIQIEEEMSPVIVHGDGHTCIIMPIRFAND